jgi:hypothetical protein
MAFYDFGFPDVGVALGLQVQDADLFSGLWIRMETVALPSKPSGARFRIDRPGCTDMLAAGRPRR